MNTLTKVIIFLAVCITVAVGVYVYVKMNNVNVVAPESNTLVTETNALSIEVTYPVIPGNTPSIKQANDFIRNEIEKKIRDFETDAKESASLGFDIPDDVKSYVAGSPSIEERNERYVAIFMGMEWYMLGAAHPFHTIDTYVYDYQKEKLVSAEEFFNAGSEYLSLLSVLSKEDLLAQEENGDVGFTYQTDMVEEGTAPKKENFMRMLPLHDGLVIYFNEYQVAAYAAGPQQVVIPYDKLAGIINPDGVLGMYKK